MKECCSRSDRADCSLARRPAARRTAAQPTAPRQTAAQQTGLGAERNARDVLQEAGLAHVAANVRYKCGELDLVMRDGSTLVFVEVRTRSSRGFGGAAASIDHRKRLRLQRAASLYLLEHFGQGAWPECRFDVVAFDGGLLNWIKGAFESR